MILRAIIKGAIDRRTKEPVDYELVIGPFEMKYEVGLYKDVVIQEGLRSLSYLGYDYPLEWKDFHVVEVEEK